MYLSYEFFSARYLFIKSQLLYYLTMAEYSQWKLSSHAVKELATLKLGTCSTHFLFFLEVFIWYILPSQSLFVWIKTQYAVKDIKANNQGNHLYTIIQFLIVVHSLAKLRTANWGLWYRFYKLLCSGKQIIKDTTWGPRCNIFPPLVALIKRCFFWKRVLWIQMYF